jgi:uncharacterized protein
VDPVRQSRHLGRLITMFTDRVPEVLHALVVSADGVPLAASERMRPGQPEQLAAITSGLVSLARSAAGLFDDGAMIQALVAMERGTLVVMAIDEGASLAVLTSAADLDLVAYEMTRLVDQIAGA